MAKAKPTKPAKRKPTWRDTPESAIPGYKVQPNPESLRPSEAMMLRCIIGMHEARALSTHGHSASRSQLFRCSMTDLTAAYAAYQQHADDCTLNALLKSVTSYVQTVCKRSGNIHADDAAQDVTVKVWQRLSQYKGQSSFKTWVRSITRRHLIDLHRRKLDPWLIDEHLDEATPQLRYDKFCGGPHSDLLSQAERLAVDTLLNTGDFDLTAEILGCTATAVRSKFERIRRKVRKSDKKA